MADRNQGGSSERTTSNRGFASMDEERQREIASKGGQSVPDEKRSFSQDRALAAQAGRKGGQSVPDEKRSFSQDRRLAAEAGRKGGEARGRKAALRNRESSVDGGGDIKRDAGAVSAVDNPKH